MFNSLLSMNELKKEEKKIIDFINQKLKSKEEENKQIKLKEYVKKKQKNNKKILITKLSGESELLTDTLINIKEPVTKLFAMITKKLNIYNIESIVIGYKSWTPKLSNYECFNYNRHSRNLYSDIINKYFDYDYEKDYIEINLIYGSYNNFLKILILEFNKKKIRINYYNDFDISKGIYNEPIYLKNMNNWFIDDLKKVQKEFYTKDDYNEIIIWLSGINNLSDVDKSFINNELNMLIN